MPGPLPVHDFERKFRAYGVKLSRSKRKPTHIKMRKRIGAQVVIYVAVEAGGGVDNLYVRKARRRFKLLPADGVSDKEFRDA